MNTLSKIIFKVDAKAEKRIAPYFLKNRKYNLTGMDEYSKYIRDFPELEKTKTLPLNEAKKILFKFIDEYYKKNYNELILKKEEIENLWKESSEEFFESVVKVFNGHPWPKGKYSANLSIFSMFRLKPGTKVFSIPIEDTGGYKDATGHIKYTLTHELMHIYVEDYYHKYFKNRLEKSKYYDFLEIMNFIVLNLPEIKKHAIWFTNPYPSHMQRCSYAQKLYSECKNMKEFVEKLIVYLNKTEEK
ncbi:hypothetical protein J4230_02540 [Candidatus Woesearchaeota archaeon]|nr:hypothetical protein [Candidatus Woesearchaeota archaeon]